MTITAPDLLHFKSETTAAGTTNGGLPSENQAVTGVKNNVWENVSADLRLSGGTQYAKLVGMVRDTGADPLDNIKGWLHGPTPGDDYVFAFKGTKTDTEADFDMTTIYAAGALTNDISIGATSCTITCEAVATTLGFHASGKIVISDQAYPGAATGTSAEVQLSATTPTINGLEVTVYFAAAIDSAFIAAVSVVGMVLEYGSAVATTGTIVVTSASGTVDETGASIICNNKGTRDEILTVSLTSATTFSVTGSRSGALGSGTVGTIFTATNPLNSATLITLPADFFSATGWLALDTVVIPTIGNNFSYWEARVIPALCDTLNGNEVIFAYTGESG